MSDAVKFGILNFVFGIFVGYLVKIMAIGKGYEIIIFALPIANFLISFFLWKTLLNKKQTVLRFLIVGIFGGIFNHYLCWIILSFITYSGYLINGSFKDSLGGPPASPIQMITGGFYFSFFSLLIFGWLTILLSLISVIVAKLFKIKTLNNKL